MQIKVKDIGISGTNFSDKIPQKKIKIDGIEIIEDIEVSALAFRTGDNVVVKLEVFSLLKEVCSRCLEDFELEVEGSVELFYQAYKDDSPITFIELNADNLGTLYYKNNSIDLTDAVRDTIVLERPIKVLCGDDCKGLCSSCGTNKNFSSCNCNQKRDNPFAEFLKKNEQNKNPSH